jgi:hypothetical protein
MNYDGRMFSRLLVLFVGCVVGCTAIDIEQPADNLPYRCSDWWLSDEW